MKCKTFSSFYFLKYIQCSYYQGLCSVDIIPQGFIPARRKYWTTAFAYGLSLKSRILDQLAGWQNLEYLISHPAKFKYPKVDMQRTKLLVKQNEETITTCPMPAKWSNSGWPCTIKLLFLVVVLWRGTNGIEMYLLRKKVIWSMGGEGCGIVSIFQ